MIDSLQRTTGIDIPVEDLGITLHQPTVKDISMLGETNYFIALQLFTMSPKQLKIESIDINGWTILQQSLKQKIEGISNTRSLIHNFLQLFFKDPIILGPRSLIITSENEVKNIEPENFDKLQFLIGEIGGKELLVPAEETFKPKNRRAAEIAEKMKKAHKRLAKVKASENGDIDVTANKGFLARYIRTVAVGTSNSLEQVNNMTILQLNEIMQIYLAKDAYELEIKIRLTGTKDDKELIHWSSTDPYKTNDNAIGRI